MPPVEQARNSLQIVNNFLHDMATGTWAACVLVILVLNPRRLGADSVVASALLDAQWAVFWLLIGALVLLAITGGFYLRTMRQRLREATPHERDVRRRMLIRKHATLLLVFGLGTAGMLLLLRS